MALAAGAASSADAVIVSTWQKNKSATDNSFERRCIRVAFIVIVIFIFIFTAFEFIFAFAFAIVVFFVEL